MKTVPVICVDGPSGVGKGTLSLQLADSLGWHLLDSGALYRVLGLACSQSAVPLDDAACSGYRGALSGCPVSVWWRRCQSLVGRQ